MVFRDQNTATLGGFDVSRHYKPAERIVKILLPEQGPPETSLTTSIPSRDWTYRIPKKLRFDEKRRRGACRAVQRRGITNFRLFVQIDRHARQQVGPTAIPKKQPRTPRATIPRQRWNWPRESILDRCGPVPEFPVRSNKTVDFSIRTQATSFLWHDLQRLRRLISTPHFGQRLDLIFLTNLVRGRRTMFRTPQA